MVDSKYLIEFSISGLVVVVLLVYALPDDLNAQLLPPTLHNQTLSQIIKQTNLSGGVPQVNVGSNPMDIYVDPTSNMIFVANSGSNTLSVISTFNNTEVKKIAVGNSPRYIDSGLGGDSIYVANAGSNYVSHIQSDGAIHNEIPISSGRSPSYIVPYDSGKLSTIYVANFFSRNVTAIDEATGKVHGIELRVPPRYLAVDGNKTYIPEYTNNSVCVIAANKTSTTCEKYISLGIGSKRPLYVAVDGNSHTIYVANFLNNSVSLINGTNQIYEKDIRVGKHPRFIYVDDSGKSSTIYVADSGDNKVSLINGTTYQLEKNITVGEGPRYITASLDGTIYVANQYSNSVSVINGTTNHFEKNIPVGKEPVNIAVDDLTDTIYVANYGSNGISVIDGQSNNSTAGITFHISPFNSGQVMCYIPKKTATPVNLHLYLWSGTKCIAEPNEGFQFSSWVENLDNNSTRTLNTTNPNDSQLRSFLHLFRINQDDPAAAFNATKFGTFTANLKPLPSPIPPEYLLAIFGLTVSLIIPSLFRWINGWRQRRNADKCIKKIDPENSEIHDQQGDAEKEIRYSNKDEAEKEIRGLYIKGKISESHLKMLNDMIDTKFKVRLGK